MLDPQTALIVVDLQKGLAGATPDFDLMVQRSRALADAFRARGLPVVLVTVDGIVPGRTEQPARFSGSAPPGYADVLPELDPQPGDILVTKRSWGAFATTDLECQLRSLGVTQVVIAGVATGSGVEATARQAYEAGFNVTLAVDAMADRRADAHAYSIASVFPRLGETGTSADILALLKGRTP
jgi:nicotinamidase-related amidase